MEYSRKNTLLAHTSSPQIPPALPRYPGPDSGFNGLERVVIDLYNDPLVDNDTLGPNRVCCLACGTRIKSLGMTYAMCRWDGHKAGCKKAQAALKELKKGRRFVPVKPMIRLRPEDLTCSAEEEQTGEGMYSAKMVQWRETYAAELQREALMTQVQPAASSSDPPSRSGESSGPKESLFATRTLPPLPNRPAIPKDVYASATYTHPNYRY
ncbi:hypothetical protein E1B28_013624 [Marasmius oreades]|uniref:Uncharacterized protein n=1 Tax=Marasmius oreades TaxID=181124 RepID=A0A9P7UP74_9AGAR|nr:uncharacterized protein E1B28_013624 [Marasmius oreades]KAG7087676.1 hypothetical protein E1B28_013624 [Marasmius oreades]